MRCYVLLESPSTSGLKDLTEDSSVKPYMLIPLPLHITLVSYVLFDSSLFNSSFLKLYLPWNIRRAAHINREEILLKIGNCMRRTDFLAKIMLVLEWFNCKNYVDLLQSTLSHCKKPHQISKMELFSEFWICLYIIPLVFKVFWISTEQL